MVVLYARLARHLPGALAIKYDANLSSIVEGFLSRLEDRGIDTIHVTLATPQRWKKTGHGSRLNACRGWCRDIAEQLSTKENEVSPDTVWAGMKRMAAGERKWPTHFNAVDGVEEPISGENASEEEVGGLADVIRLFATTNGLWLTEEIDGQKYRLLGGQVVEGGKDE